MNEEIYGAIFEFEDSDNEFVRDHLDVVMDICSRLYSKNVALHKLNTFDLKKAIAELEYLVDCAEANKGDY